MNTSQFMDKQIMDPSKSQSNNSDFIGLTYPQEEDNGGKDEIVPSYDFQPIRPVGAPPQLSNSDPGIGVRAKVLNSADTKVNSAGIGVRNYSSLDSVELSKVVPEKDYNASNVALVYEIDQTLKNHADNLMHALEGVSARISHLESRTSNLENSVGDLKVAVGNYHGSTDGKLRQLDNVVGEVQKGVQVIQEKQEILDVRLHLPKLRGSKVPQSNVQLDSFQQIASAPLQSRQQKPAPPSMTQPPPSPSAPNAPPSNSQRDLAPPVHLQDQFSPDLIPPVPQRDRYVPLPGQPQEAANQQYQPSPQPSQPPPSGPQLLVPQYQPPPPPQYSLPPMSQHHPHVSSVNPSHPQLPLVQHPEEASPQNYPPNLHQPPHPATAASHPPQHFYGSSSQMYEPPSSRPGLDYSPSYGHSSGPNEPVPHPYGGSPSLYGESGMKLQPPPSSQSGGSSYPLLPAARVTPHALPTASGVGGGSSGSSSPGNRVLIDDVVDKVTNMGFSREIVRAIVGKLTENGQSVDLNIVLDKLNDGVEAQPLTWYGR